MPAAHATPCLGTCFPPLSSGRLPWFKSRWRVSEGCERNAGPVKGLLSPALPLNSRDLRPTFWYLNFLISQGCNRIIWNMGTNELYKLQSAVYKCRTVAFSRTPWSARSYYTVFMQTVSTQNTGLALIVFVIMGLACSETCKIISRRRKDEWSNLMNYFIPFLFLKKITCPLLRGQRKLQHKEIRSEHQSHLKRYSSVHEKVVCDLPEAWEREVSQSRSCLILRGKPPRGDGFLAEVRVHTKSKLDFFLKQWKS